MSDQRLDTCERPSERSAWDLVLLIATAAFLVAGGFTGFLLSDEYKFGQFWVWGTLMGPATFFPGARFLRRKFRQRGFLYYCAAWFPTHMAVMYAAMARLPILIAAFVPLVMPGTLAVMGAHWLFGPPAGARKLSALFGRREGSE